MKKFTLFLLILTLISYLGNAQQQKLDSLYRELNKSQKNKVLKLKIFNDLADTYLWIQKDSGIKYANKAIELATVLGKKKELADAYNTKAENLLSKSLDSSTEKLIKQSLAINLQLKNLNGLADNYITLASYMRFKGKIDTSIFLLDKAKQYYLQTKNKNGIAFANCNYGWWILINQMDSNCVAYFLDALKLFTEIDYSPGIGICYNGLGCYYSNKAEFITSLEYFNKAVAINSRNNLRTNLSQDYANINQLYFYVSNYPKAMNYLLKALRLSERTGCLDLEAYDLIALGNLYYYLKNYALALDYTLKGTAVQEKAKFKQLLPWSYSTIGIIYSKLNNHTLAFEYINKAISLSLEMNDSAILSSIYSKLGEAQLKAMHYANAIVSFNKSLSITNKLYGKSNGASLLPELGRCISLASDETLKKVGINPATKNELIVKYFEQAKNETSDISIREDACLELSKFYEQHADLSKAFSYYKQYILYRDSILNEENTKSLTNLQLQYETEKKEQQIALLTKDKKLQASKIQKNKTLTIAYIGGIAFIVIMIGIMYRGYRLKLSANKKIESTLTHLQTTQTQLVQQGKLSSLGKMTADVALEIQHPLHELNIHTNGCEILIDDYLNETDEDTKNSILSKLQFAMEKINEQGKIADGIVKNILIQHRK